MTRPLEAESTNTIIEGAMALGFRVHHCRAARTQSGRWATPIQGTPGFPDVILCGFGRAIAVELKRHPNKPTNDQVAWLAEMSRAGLDARLVYTPEGVAGLLSELTAIRAANHRKMHDT